MQGAVEMALKQITGSDVSIIGSGRTDTGVHASGQVIAFDLDWAHSATAIMKAVNSKLPYSVAITKIQVAVDDFHPRFDALWREYTYTVVVSQTPSPLNRLRAWVVSYQLDVARMVEAAALLQGERDWGALGTPPHGANTVRDIYKSVWQTAHIVDTPTYVYTIRANAFLYRMVRRTVGMMVDVGRGKLSLDKMQQIIACTDVASNVTVAPPEGLVLAQVRYPDDECDKHNV